MKFTEHTKLRKEKFGMVVFDTLTEKIFITDQIGSEILQLITEGNNMPEIVRELRDEFDGDEQIMEKDVIDFTEQLKSNNIVSV